MFEMLGEAVKGAPDKWCELETEIPWRQIAGFRDMLSHAYFLIETRIVWQAAVKKAPALRVTCKRLLSR